MFGGRGEALMGRTIESTTRKVMKSDRLRLGCRGGGPQGIFTVRPELLVPFAGKWAV